MCKQSAEEGWTELGGEQWRRTGEGKENAKNLSLKAN